jgi:hypothetical protein
MIAVILVALLLAPKSCTPPQVVVHYERDGGRRLSGAERNVIERIANDTATEVRHFLPALPTHLELMVRTGTKVILETGENAATFPPDYVSWTVDPHLAGGVEGTARRELRGTLFHEFYHLVREQTIRGMSPLDRTVGEGLATAFERDAAGAPVPWGRYSDDVSAWATEFMAVPNEDAKFDEWMAGHPERQWAGFKVGTYLADAASTTSRKTAAELVVLPTSTIVAMAMNR